MMERVENLGVGPRMTQWIRILYDHHTAAVKVNNSLSPSFEMFNGTRQECLLSPLLFVLSLEPLLAIICGSVDIWGVKIGVTAHKVAAYAADVLFYITNPRTTLPNLIKEQKKYGELSNLKINPVKSEILNISLRRKNERYRENFPSYGGKLS